MTFNRCNWLRKHMLFFWDTDIETVYSTWNDLHLKVTQGHGQLMLSFVRSTGLSTTERKSKLHLFSEKVVEMTLKVDHSHWRWYSSMPPYAVCLPVTFVYCVEKSKHILKLFSPLGSHTILVFPYQTLKQYSDGNPLMGARQRRMQRVWKNSRFSTNILLYLGNDTRQEHITMESQQELVCDLSNSTIIIMNNFDVLQKPCKPAWKTAFLPQKMGA